MGIRDRVKGRYLWFGVSTAIIVGLIYVADVGRFIESLRSARPLPLVPALFFGLAVLPLWSHVWYRIFRKTGIEVPYLKSFRIFMAGNFMNSITPLGQAGGEPLMAYLLEKNSDASYEKSLSSIFSADVMNGIPSLTFVIGGATYLALFQTLNQTVLQGLYIALLIAAIGGATVYLLWFKSGTIEGKILKIVETITEKIGRGEKLAETLREKLDRIEENFRIIGEEPGYLLKTAALSHIGFLCQVFNFYFIMLALNHTPEIAPIYFVVVLSGLAGFSPTPGGSGTYEAAMAGLTTVFFSVNFTTGLTAAILFRLTTYWPGILLGWLSLNTLNQTAQN